MNYSKVDKLLVKDEEVIMLGEIYSEENPYTYDNLPFQTGFFKFESMQKLVDGADFGIFFDLSESNFAVDLYMVKNGKAELLVKTNSRSNNALSQMYSLISGGEGYPKRKLFMSDFEVEVVSTIINSQRTDDMKRMIRSLYQHMILFQNYVRDNSYKEEIIHTQQVKKSGSSKKKSKQKNRIIKLTSRKIYLGESQSEIKRSYERHTESWNVRGHWRTYKKTGKTIWIPSYPKGDGEVRGKDYKL